MLHAALYLPVQHQMNQHSYQRYIDSPNLPQLPPRPGPAPTWPLPALPSQGLRRESTGSEMSSNQEGPQELREGDDSRG
jgi:hypothetical protein